jgi:hypothetical protein
VDFADELDASRARLVAEPRHELGEAGLHEEAARPRALDGERDGVESNGADPVRDEPVEVGCETGARLGRLDVEVDHVGRIADAERRPELHGRLVGTHAVGRGERAPTAEDRGVLLGRRPGREHAVDPQEERRRGRGIAAPEVVLERLRRGRDVVADQVEDDIRALRDPLDVGPVAEARLDHGMVEGGEAAISGRPEWRQDVDRAEDPGERSLEQRREGTQVPAQRVGIGDQRGRVGERTALRHRRTLSRMLAQRINRQERGAMRRRA